MERLKAIVKLIPPYDYFADIGCDHGYLIKLAFEAGIKKAQAIDNKVKPLQNAQNNLINFQNNVEFSLSDGLSKLNSDIECIVLAGLGGLAIKQILNKTPEKLGKIKRIITSPHKNVAEVRLFLSNRGFCIVSEQVIYEDGQYYEIIVFDKGYCAYNEAEIIFGPLNLLQKSPTWLKMWTDYLSILEKVKHKDAIKKYEYIKKYVLPKGGKND